MFLRLGTWTVPSLSRRDVAGTGDVGERKNQLICTTRLTHYTIAAARDLVWGGDFLGDDDGRRGASGSVWFGKFRTTRPTALLSDFGAQTYPFFITKPEEKRINLSAYKKL